MEGVRLPLPIENGAEQIKSQRLDIWRDSIRESQAGFT
jgi:hypothetical protein